MSESTFVLPSPAAAIAASLKADAADASQSADATQTAAATTAAATQDTTQTKIAEAPKQTLSESMATISDAPPVEQKKEVKVETPATSDEPKEGEKPAAFIKRLKAERADALNQLKTAREQLEKKGGESNTDEIAALRKEIEARDKTLEIAAYERSPQYQEQFVKPEKEAIDGAKKLIATFTDKKGILERALALEGKERLDFLEENMEKGAVAVFDRLDRVDEARARKAAALNNNAEHSKALLASQQQAADADLLKGFDGMQEDISKRLSVFRSENGPELVSKARSLLTGEASHADILSAAYLAVAAPHYISENGKLRATIATLEARIKEDNEHRGSINGRGSETGKTPGAVEVVDGKIPSPKEVVRRQVAEMRS